jgi:YVTN family beta-propeller protein
VDLATLAVLAKVPAQANPDAISYDSARNVVYAWNHTGKSATVIDAKTNAVIATIPLSGTAESGQVDAVLGRAYVNIEDTSSVDVIDAVSHKVIGNWKVAPAEEPTGMAIDVANHRLFVGGGPNMVMLDGRTGKVLASLPICEGTDATWFDSAASLVFASCGGGGGAITVGRVSGANLSAVATIATTKGARTMALDPMTHRLYVAGQNYGPSGAVVPDSFHVLVFGIP